MKTKFLILLFFILNAFLTSAIGQTTIKYFDNNHRVVSEKDAVLRETKTKLSDGYAIEKYDLKLKQILSYISYSDYSLKEGLCKLYTDGGVVSEGKYHIDLPIGKWKIFEAGKLKKVIDYTEALEYFLPYNAERVQDAYSGFGLITAQNEVFKQEDTDDKGLKFVSDLYPTFKNYLASEIYLNANIVMKDLASGSYRASISFTVDKQGKVTSPILDYFTPSELSLEFIRVLLNSPKWIPAKENGKPISMTYTLIMPIQITNE